MTGADAAWKVGINDVMRLGNEYAPRGQKVKELLSYSYALPMAHSVITVASRKMNYKFMFAEAAWIVSGSNWLDGLTDYLPRYADFSDDQVFLHGAYGPKVAEQYTYVVNTLVNDKDSRQAVMNIWRERPGTSKDIPCTLSLQFFIRNQMLDCVATMRSQDAIWGMCYDVFTFSMVANMIRLLLLKRGVSVALGTLHLTAGSFHIYERHYDETTKWLSCTKRDAASDKVLRQTQHIATAAIEPRQFINLLKEYADA